MTDGGHVRIVSPSGPVHTQHLDEAVDVLRTWGLDVSIDADAFARDGRYFAGSDDIRRTAFQRALDDPNVDAILCSRGGYGSMRIIDQIDWSSLQRDPRIICGFSDVTALHFAALSSGVATLHGHVAKSFGSQAADLDLLRATWFGERGPISVPVQPISGGRATGPLLGGNLSLVAALAGSSYLPPLRGAVLFVEDVTEEDYRLDRLFRSLLLNPHFDDLAAVILGDFNECEGTYVTAAEMPAFLLELGAELGAAWRVPVVAGFPAGHADRNFPLPFGVNVTVDADSATVTFDEELVQ